MALQIILSHNTLLKKSLKLVSAIFHFFTKWQPLDISEKCFLLYLKNSFRSQDIQIFVFLSSPLFPPVSHCFSGCSKINLKVYDVINWLNKNLITHFVWYLEKKKDMALKLCPLIGYWIRSTFMEKSCRKCEPKASPRPLFNFGK